MSLTSEKRDSGYSNPTGFFIKDFIPLFATGRYEK